MDHRQMDEDRRARRHAGGFPIHARCIAWICTLGLLVGIGQANAQTSFGSCPDEAFQTIGTTPPGSVVTLYEIDLANGTLTPLGGSSALNGVGAAGGVNAIGFNQADGFIYGFNNATDQIVRIGQGGQAVNVGPPQTALASIGMIGGDVIAGQLYTYAGSNLYVFDPATGALVQTIAAGSAIGGGDFAYNPLDGLLYAVNNPGAILTVDPGTGAVATLPGVSLPAGNYGAAYFDNEGSLYAYDNGSGSGSGTIYRVRNLGKPGQDVVEAIATGPTTTQNDGTRCAAAPPPAALVEATKSLLDESIAADGIAQPGEQLTYQIQLDNVGQLATSGPYSYYEVLPANTTLVSVTGGSSDCAAGVAGASLCTLTTSAPVAAGGAQTMQLVVEVADPLPADSGSILNLVSDGTGDPPPAGCTTSGQACTTPPTCDPADDPAHCVVTPWAQVLDLQVVKDVDRTSARSGETVTYTLTVGNAGNASVADAVLTDTPGAGVDCSGTPAVTCSATGGAQCPADPIAVADLTGSGIVVPLMPADGEVVLTLQCVVTASGP